MMICAECGSTEDDDHPDYDLEEESIPIYTMCGDCYNNPPETYPR